MWLRKSPDDWLSVCLVNFGVFGIQQAQKYKLITSQNVQFTEFKHLSDLSYLFLIQIRALPQCWWSQYLPLINLPKDLQEIAALQDQLNVDDVFHALEFGGRILNFDQLAPRISQVIRINWPQQWWANP